MKNNVNIMQLVRENIKQMKSYASARDDYQLGTSGMVFLDANENPFDNGVNRYPDPQQRELKAKLSELKGVPVANMLLGNGSDEVLDLIFRAFCEPNQDEIVTLPPTYGMYDVLANLNAVGNRQIVLNSDFQPDVARILQEQTETTKLLFICSPNNPTANSFEANAIARLIEGFQGIVVIDEAYVDFTEAQSWTSRLSEFPNLIVTQTLSKAYGMAAIRLGICYASETIISILNRIKPPYNVNVLTQAKALQRLAQSDVISEEIQLLTTQRQWLSNQLKAVSFVDVVYPSDANFILAKVDNANKRYAQLIDKKVVVRNRTKQPLCDNCLRFTVGSPKENEILVQALLELQEDSI